MVRLKEWNADLPGCRSPVILTRNTNPESYIQWKSYTIAHAGYKPSDAQDGRVNTEIIGQSTTYSSDLLVVVGEIKLFHCSFFTDCHGSLENKPLLSRMQNEPYPYLIPGL